MPSLVVASAVSRPPGSLRVSSPRGVDVTPPPRSTESSLHACGSLRTHSTPLPRRSQRHCRTRSQRHRRTHAPVTANASRSLLLIHHISAIDKKINRSDIARHLCASNRPFYEMARGPTTILTARVYSLLNKEDAHHPRIRRHHAAILAIQHYKAEQDPMANPISTSRSTVPRVLRCVVQHYNRHYLNKEGDLKISAISLWRFLYARNISPHENDAHHCIYTKKNPPVPRLLQGKLPEASP